METTVYDPPRRVVFETTAGPLSGEIEWLLEPDDDGTTGPTAGVGGDTEPGGGSEPEPEAGAGARTRFTYRADYHLSSSVLDRVAEPIVRRYNRRQLDRTVENLRDRFASDGDDC
jgi:hypothetical protein